MYLSRLILDPRSRQVASELERPYEMHRTLTRAFDDGGQGDRVLFRADVHPRTGVPTVLVQSEARPDWSFTAGLGRYLLEPAECGSENPAWRPYGLTFRTGQRLRFRLRANPTFRTQGKRRAWLREEDRIRWLGRRAEAGGFEVESVLVVPEGFVRDTKRENGTEHELTLASVLFDGVLQVRDPEAFAGALRSGIGSGKAFGFGLLSVMRCG